MFANPSYGMPSPNGYPYNYTTTPLNSPPLGAGAGMHNYWGPDFSHTPAPTPQPQSSPYAGSGRSGSSQRRRQSGQMHSFPTTPQPNRTSGTPGNFSPYYNTPSPRPSSFVAAPSPGQDYYYTMGPQGPVPSTAGGYASPLSSEYDYAPPGSPSMHPPPPREGRRSRNSKTRTPGPGPNGSDLPHSPPPTAEDIRNNYTPSRDAAAAAAHGIPQGYSTKNWDQQERPIMLLGSVFDANSLGKWIYDWTVFRHGTNSDVTEKAGELWLLLIQLSGKSKRARDCVDHHRIKKRENLQLVNEFLDSGDRLWDRMKRLLKHCEEYMWKGAQAVQGTDPSVVRKGSPGVTMGKQSGKEFVDAMFNKDRELERTEKLMTGMRLWSSRFDANCEEILRRPHAD